MAVGVDIDLPVQTDRRFQRQGEAPLQRPFDEIAIEAAEQLLRLLTAEMKVCEVVHGEGF